MANMYVLGGGSSKRMHLDKVNLFLGNLLVVDILYNNLYSLFENHYLVINNSINAKSKKYHIIYDCFNLRAAINGIITSLKNTNNYKNFICACDMPFIKKELVSFLLSYDGYDVVIPKNKDGLFEPLCAVYSKDFLNIAEFYFYKEEFSLNKIIRNSNFKEIEAEEIKKYDDKYVSFINFNSIDDMEGFYEQIREKC